MKIVTIVSVIEDAEQEIVPITFEEKTEELITKLTSEFVKKVNEILKTTGSELTKKEINRFFAD